MYLACPKCRARLELKVVRGTDIEHCPHCSGIWFDRGKLERILLSGGENHVRAISLAHIDMAPDGDRDWKALWYDEQLGDCPRCHREMTRTESPDRKDLFIDVCDECGGNWYDGGEVDDLFTYVKDDSLVGLLRRFFLRR